MTCRTSEGELIFNPNMTEDEAEMLFLSTLKSIPKDHEVLTTIDTGSCNGYVLWQQLEQFFDNVTESSIVLQQQKREFENLENAHLSAGH